MRIVIEFDSSQQMDDKKWHTCALMSRQMSVLDLCFLMKLDGIARGMKDGGMSVNSLRSSYSTIQ